MRSALTCMLLGGTSFWGLDILIAATKHWASADVIGVPMMTILLPAIPVVTYLITRRFIKPDKSGPSVALFMGIGIWIFGPLGMTVAATFSGGGFHSWTGISNLGYLLLFSVFPVYTLMMSTYDGSLFGLVLVSVLMLVLHLTFERQHWLLPPAARSFFRLGRHTRGTEHGIN